MRAQIRPAIVSLALFTLITGIVYPLLITGIARVAYPHQSNGSLIVQDGKVVGSELIGQPFDAPTYFWGRLSATSPYPYNAVASMGSNQGPASPALEEMVKARIAALKAADPQNTLPIPVDLVTSSGSGLDPDISLESALYQIPRIARARNVSQEAVRALVDKYTQGYQFGLLGAPRVNVLQLNLALDQIQ